MTTSHHPRNFTKLILSSNQYTVFATKSCAGLIPRGFKKPNHITGLSFLPTLLGKKQNKHEYLYWETNSRQGQQALRMDKWKAIRRNIATGNKEIELFDLTLDSKEKNDVSKSNLDVISQIEIIFKEARTTPTLKNFYIKGLDF